MRFLQFVRALLVSLVLILFVVYASIFEPYCFHKSWTNSRNLVNTFLSPIEKFKEARFPTSESDLIVILIPRITKTLINRFQYFDEHFSDNFSTSILFLYTSPMEKRKFVDLSNSMKRQTLFLDINSAFHLFPIGLDACREKTSYRVRGKWNYLLMIRFWFKSLFELPQLKNYQYIMRLDDDSRIRGRWFNVFDEMRRKDAVYFANNCDVDLEDQLPGTMLVANFTSNYVKTNGIVPKQMEMLKNAFSNRTVKNFYNNFEVCRLDFFRSESIQHWAQAIDDSLGIFRYRWGDAVLRYLTVAVFARPEQVLHRDLYNLTYCHKCWSSFDLFSFHCWVSVREEISSFFF